MKSFLSRAVLPASESRKGCTIYAFFAGYDKTAMRQAAAALHAQRPEIALPLHSRDSAWPPKQDFFMSIVWTFDQLSGVGGHHTVVEGAPTLIDTPAGKAVLFDGDDDGIYVDNHPLAGADQFTIEAVFRPDCGAFEQRWLHLAEADAANGDAQSPRTLFEIRVKDGAWYLDAFTTGPGYNTALAVPEKTFPVGHWYAVQQTFDGKVYRSYVNGVEQASAELAYKPQGQGRTSIGMRINKVTPFKGAVLCARFTPRALGAGEFAPLPAGL
jgi:hypothetical protein